MLANVEMTAVAKGFPPVAGKRPRVLILGSLPSRQSILRQQYYAHPRNTFWPVIAAVLQADLSTSYRQKTTAVRKAGIAIWDVLDSSVRPGSMDAAIVESTARANDIIGFLQRHDGIRAIFFNGQTAARLFHKRMRQDLAGLARPIDLHTMPSTSPAHAALSLQQKIERWSLLTSYLSEN